MMIHGEKKMGAGRVVAVAIENNKSSQHAAKWAVDNLVPRDQCLLLIHVRQKVSSIPTPSNSYTSLSLFLFNFLPNTLSFYFIIQFLSFPL